jgi:Rab GTPase-binding effector protein 1
VLKRFSPFLLLLFTAILQSVKSELEREAKVRAETEAKLRETDASLKSIQAKSKQLINALQHQVEEQSTARVNIPQPL